MAKPKPDDYSIVIEEYSLVRAEEDILVTLAGNGVPFRKGRTWGPYEHCYPNEGGYCEDITAFDSAGNVVELTKEEELNANAALWEALCNSYDGPDYDGPDNYDYDEPRDIND